jgi:hypothetical protein
MADFDSQLPIRSDATDAEVNVGQVGGNAVSTGSGVVDSGTIRVVTPSDVTVNVDLDSLNGTAISTNDGTVDAGTIRVTQANDVVLNTDLDSLAGNAIDLGAGNAGSATQRVIIASDQPAIPVDISGSSDKTNVVDFDQSTATAAAATKSHSFTPAANTYFTGFSASGSGQARMEVKWGVTASETTKNVQFSTKGNLNMKFELSDPVLLTSSDTVIIEVTNTDNQAQDLYSTIEGYLA